MRPCSWRSSSWSDGSIRVRGGAKCDTAGGPPEDVLRLCAAAQYHLGGASLGNTSGNLEDPHLVRRAREGDVLGDGDVAGPLVEAASQGQPADVSRAQVDGSGVRWSGSVGVGDFHVTYWRCQG